MTNRARWADAAAVLAVIVTVLIAARQLRPLVDAGAFYARTGDVLTPVPIQSYLRAAVWLAIAVAVLLRWRVAAAAGAWAAVAYEVVLVVLRVNSGKPNPGLDLLVWPVALATLGAVLLSLPGRGSELLRRPGRWLLLAAGLAASLSAAAIPLLGDYYGRPPANSIDPGFYVIFGVPSTLARTVVVATVATVLVLTLSSVVTLDAPVRRRAATLVLAAAVAGFVIELGMPIPFGWLDYLSVSPAVEAVLLVAGPALVLAAGLGYIRLRERPAAGAGALA